MDWDGNRAYADYSDFYVDDENSNYTLHLGSFLGGTAGDSLMAHNNMKFSTRDRDNDLYVRNRGCGDDYNSGWWFVGCFPSNLNGMMRAPPSHNNTWHGIIWDSCHHMYSFKEASMKIRPY